MYGSKAKALNVKNMKETLVNYCSGNQKDYDEIWMGFRQMRMLGFITEDTWKKFFNDTCGWTIDGDFLMDYNHDEEPTVVFDFNNGARGNGEYKEYRA